MTPSKYTAQVAAAKAERAAVLKSLIAALFQRKSGAYAQA